MTPDQIADIEKTLGKAKAGFDSQYFKKVGLYRVEILSVAYNPDATLGKTHITQCKILKATQTDPNIAPHPVGSTMSFLVAPLQGGRNGGKEGLAKSAIVKRHLMAVLGIDEDTEAKLIRYIYGPEQICAYAHADVEVYFRTLPAKDGKPEKKDFTDVRWLNVGDAEQPSEAEIAAKRKAANLPEQPDLKKILG